MNGRPVTPEDEEAPRRRRSSRRDRGDLGATCKRNRDCEHRACWVGRGDLGYCTKTCDSFSDCPFKWECKRAATNAPQKICVQSSW